MSTQDLVRQLRTFLDKAEENPKGAVRLKPAAENLLRMAQENATELSGAIADLKQWIGEKDCPPN